MQDIKKALDEQIKQLEHELTTELPRRSKKPLRSAISPKTPSTTWPSSAKSSSTPASASSSAAWLSSPSSTWPTSHTTGSASAPRSSYSGHRQGPGTHLQARHQRRVRRRQRPHLHHLAHRPRPHRQRGRRHRHRNHPHPVNASSKSSNSPPSTTPPPRRPHAPLVFSSLRLRPPDRPRNAHPFRPDDSTAPFLPVCKHPRRARSPRSLDRRSRVPRLRRTGIVRKTRSASYLADNPSRARGSFHRLHLRRRSE